MWTTGWRESVWSGIRGPWDLIVVGGGITGAGILRESARAGLRALLVEADDFASGTSSRSSKMVHGGLRYLSSLNIKLTMESVRERECLLAEGGGLIEPLESIIASYEGDRMPAWVVSAALTVYDLLALRWRHRHYPPARVKELCPSINADGMVGGYGFFDAWTDDARLVLRVIREAVRAGGTALSYAPVEGLVRDRAGRVCGVQLRDKIRGRETEVLAPVVISATGAWADTLRAHLDAKPRLRPLRGSHLFFPRERLPLTQWISFLHPADARPVFAYPWEGVTLLGTTDVDQGPDVPRDPQLSSREVAYLMQAATYAFKPLDLTESDVQSTMSGVRPVVDSGQADPSKESREFVLWDESGLLTVTGGKLTTFRVMAVEALRSVRRRLPGGTKFRRGERVLDSAAAEILGGLDPVTRTRLAGRYGVEAGELVAAARDGELTTIGATPALWAELRWAARAEGVVHLDDLLLRRVRLGILAPQGGLPLANQIRAVVQPELGWDDARWQAEWDIYWRLRQQCYCLGGR
jgi:glycerol-3-phosphate dehydrogenase